MKQLLFSLLFIPFSFLTAQQSEFKIGSYGAPPADEQTHYHFKDVGFNAALGVNPGLYNPWKPCNGPSEDINKWRVETLKMATEKEIAIYLGESFINLPHDSYLTKLFNGQSAFHGATFPAISGDLKGSGWTLPRALRLKKALNSKYPGKQYIAELYPTYADRAKIGDFKPEAKENYQTYVRLILEKMKLDAVGLGHYPNTSGTGEKGSFATAMEKDAFIQNLEWVAPIAKETNTPLWSYIMLSAHKDKAYAPNLAMINMMINSSLSYGAKGIFYHRTYKACSGNGLNEEYYGPFLLDMRATNVKYWNDLKKVNRSLAYLGPHIMRSNWMRTERIQNNEENKICLDSCELIYVSEYDTMQLEKSEKLSDFKKDGYAACEIAKVDRRVDSLKLEELIAARDRMVDSLKNLAKDPVRDEEIEKSDEPSNEDRRRSEEKDPMDEDWLGDVDTSIVTPYLYNHTIICERKVPVDVSKNVHISATGQKLDLAMGIFEYGDKGNRMLILTNYNYEEGTAANVSFKMDEYYEAIDLLYKDRQINRPEAEFEFSIAPGDMKVLVLKKR